MLKDLIKKKLKSEQGTSIFFGLLLFLAASILSVVIINGASTTVKRVVSDKKTEQNYLACSSAAKLLQEKIENTVITKTTVITEKKIKDDPVEFKTDTVEKWSDGLDEFGSLLLKYVKELANLPNGATNGTVKWNIAVENAGSSTEAAMPEVTALCTISPNLNNTPKPGFDISVILKCEDGVNSCQMLLRLKGQYTIVSKSGTNEEEENTTTIEEKYQWSGVVIESGDKISSVEDK